jgi:hypothetical protein
MKQAPSWLMFLLFQIKKTWKWTLNRHLNYNHIQLFQNSWTCLSYNVQQIFTTCWWYYSIFDWRVKGKGIWPMGWVVLAYVNSNVRIVK